MKTQNFSILFLALLVLSACARSGAGRHSFVAKEDQAEAASDFKKQYIEKFVQDEDEYLLASGEIPAPETENLVDDGELDGGPTPKAAVKVPPKPETAPVTDYKRGGIITPTIYYNPIYHDDDQACKEDARVSMKEKSGKTLIKVCRNIAKECGLQGSCTIEQNGELRLFNILNRINGQDYFFEMDREECSYGYGVRSLCLVPYHTLAADLTIYKAGQVIYIPSMKGIKLPNGRLHSGYFVVRDRGRAIKGAGRFDFFTGFLNWTDPANPFVKVGLGNKDTDMVFYIVKGEAAKKALRYEGVSI
jgi:3D (Asp-Asp-Asp) domain-containing protein